jgi:hypothetical protein
MRKKYGHTKRRFISSLIMAAMLLTGTSAAYAAEVPAGVTEVKIPLALESASAIAGAEIAFSQSNGLEYVRFEPAGGAENPMKTTAGGTTWIGFFSATNKYRPSDGTLSFGNLVFRYAGEDPEKVTIAETRLHSLTGEGSDVKSVRGKPNTVIPVTRNAASPTERNDDPDPVVVSTRPPDEGSSGSNGTGGTDGAGDTNGDGAGGTIAGGAGGTIAGGANNTSGAKDANDKSNDKSGANTKNNKSDTNGANGTSGNGGTSRTNGASGSVNAASGSGSSGRTTGGSANDGEAVSDAIVASGDTGDSGEAEASAMVPFSAPDILAAGDIPLAGATEQSANAQGKFSAWLIAAALIAGLLAGALLVLFILKRKRRSENSSESETT